MTLAVYDENNDGTISKEELHAILSGYEGSDLDDVITAADVNNDGKLSIQGMLLVRQLSVVSRGGSHPIRESVLGLIESMKQNVCCP